MRRLIRWLGGTLLVAVAATMAGGWYLLSVALQPHVQRDAEACYARFCRTYPTLQPWADSLRTAGALREVTIMADDGATLQAFYIAAPTPSKRTAIPVHGYTDHPFGMLQYAWLYQRELNCNVLLPALRYHGASEGRAIQMGWFDREDVLRWIGEADRLFGEGQQMVVHGVSMGAATTMMLAGDDRLPRSVRCLVEDCGYTSVWEQFRKELREDYGLPAFPLLYAADLLCRLRYGWGFREASALKQVAGCDRPMLFIHGGNDTYVPTAMAEPLYAAKQGAKALWIAPDSPHASSFADHPAEYAARVKAFVEQYLP